MEKTIKILMVDQDKNTLEIECSIHLFRQLNNGKNKVKQHKSRRKLHFTIDDFLSENNK